MELSKSESNHSYLYKVDSSNYVAHIFTERADKSGAVGRIDKYNSVTNRSLLLTNKGISYETRARGTSFEADEDARDFKSNQGINKGQSQGTQQRIKSSSLNNGINLLTT